MLRQFAVLIVCVALFAWVGMEVGGPNAGLFGALLAAAFVMMAQSVSSGARKARVGAPLVHVRQQVLCVPTGSHATVEMVHDGHHWCDVEHCSLCEDGGRPECHKRCLDLMNDAAPPRRTVGV